MSARSHSRARANTKRRTAQAAYARAHQAMVLDPPEGGTHTAASSERAAQHLVRSGVVGGHILEEGQGMRPER